jgi:phenylpropionate dioxygenase-like ring-hydroxylating dioxygenase large terminal subunit
MTVVEFERPEDVSSSMEGWVRTCVDADAFADEQARLAQVWNFAGFTRDVAAVGDWITAKVGGREIFVQRFKEGLRAFENRCAHRHYPLKVGERGNSPLVCGFHHWKYDDTGLALGIPKCVELFGALPRELNRRLTQLDVDTCGGFVFVRFRGDRYQESLEQSLGDLFPIVSTLCPDGAQWEYTERDVAANWKLFYQITLDDYHLAAVHPATFGKLGYLERGDLTYHRVGRHSALFGAADDPTGLKMAADECRRGVFQPNLYRILQLFPNLLIVQAVITKVCGTALWSTAIQHIQPTGPGSCRVKSWAKRDLHGAGEKGPHPLASLAKPLLIKKARDLGNRLLKEDAAACENLQHVMGQIDRPGVFGATEERIRWFNETYADVTGV